MYPGNIQEGQLTSRIYSLIRDRYYDAAIDILNDLLQTYPNNRAGLSLLAHCYYHSEDYYSASSCYETLYESYPEVTDYQICHVQSLYKGGQYEDALRVVSQIEDAEYQEKVPILRACIKYAEEDVLSTNKFLQDCQEDLPETDINKGCVLYQTGEFDDALHHFNRARITLDFDPQLMYNIALCHYRMNNYTPALAVLGSIIAQGVQQYPDLKASKLNQEGSLCALGSSYLDDPERSCFSDSSEYHMTATTLYELNASGLVQAYNLKAAIEYHNKNVSEARDSLDSIPNHLISSNNLITIHNQTILNIHHNIKEGLETLECILHKNSTDMPSELLSNMLLLCCKYEWYDVAAVYIGNPQWKHIFISDYVHDFISACILKTSYPEESLVHFETLTCNLVDIIRKFNKELQDALEMEDEESIGKVQMKIENAQEKLLPVIMHKASLYWQSGNYEEVIEILRKCMDFCKDNPIWKLNVAHTLFMQENKHKEAANYYEEIVNNQYDDILQVNAHVLANVCVLYAILDNNLEAVELLLKIEKEEKLLALQDPDVTTNHTCVANMVLGTFYCVNGNYEYGISRIIKSLEPFGQHITGDLWLNSKRCFLSMIENMSKHNLVMKDTVLQECIKCLDQCQVSGENVSSTSNVFANEKNQTSVADDAILLKSLLIKFLP